MVYLLLKRRRKYLRLGAIGVLLLLVYLSGLPVILLETSYHPDRFQYPYQIPSLAQVIDQYKSSLVPAVPPPNEYRYPFLHAMEEKCKKTSSDDGGAQVDLNVTLLLVIKSAISHRKQREAIRLSWGFENRFSDVVFRRIFVVGSCESVTFSDTYESCEDSIAKEVSESSDIVQADFVDTYFNNTIKMMMAYKWIINYCSQAQFILFVDDDYYVSTKNLLKFVRNPFFYKTKFDYSLDPFARPPNLPAAYDGRLYAGFVFSSSRPKRDKLSKWAISLADYAYSRYPPYVTAGAIVLSNLALLDMYYASLYTKHFRFDDIYVAILAKRVNITPLHNENFYFYKKSYSKSGYSDVIASHGFSDVKELLSAWEEQKTMGNA